MKNAGTGNLRFEIFKMPIGWRIVEYMDNGDVYARYTFQRSEELMYYLDMRIV